MWLASGPNGAEPRASPRRNHLYSGGPCNLSPAPALCPGPEVNIAESLRFWRMVLSGLRRDWVGLLRTVAVADCDLLHALAEALPETAEDTSSPCRRPLWTQLVRHP